jgi:carbamoyltransferase
MIILGINAYHGDVWAVLLRDGELVAAVEEEWFRRVKHWAGFPREAIRTCLDMAGVTPKEVDHFAISRNPRANLLRKALFTLRNRPSFGMVRDRARNFGRVRDLATTLSEALGVKGEDIKAKMHWVEHHPAHLASTFFVSSFEEAAVCAIDGFGDFVRANRQVGRCPPCGGIRPGSLHGALGALHRRETGRGAEGFASVGCIRRPSDHQCAHRNRP